MGLQMPLPFCDNSVVLMVCISCQVRMQLEFAQRSHRLQFLAARQIAWFQTQARYFYSARSIRTHKNGVSRDASISHVGNRDLSSRSKVFTRSSLLSTLFKLWRRPHGSLVQGLAPATPLQNHAHDVCLIAAGSWPAFGDSTPVRHQDLNVQDD